MITRIKRRLIEKLIDDRHLFRICIVLGSIHRGERQITAKLATRTNQFFQIFLASKTSFATFFAVEFHEARFFDTQLGDFM